MSVLDCCRLRFIAHNNVTTANGDDGDADESRRRSAAIDRKLLEERRQMRVQKLLLIGISESGKSTFIKMLRLLHDPHGLGDEQ
jgi:ABC-type multidrug transport system fused ATPase/permease subunit